jgi:hypothetical protein
MKFAAKACLALAGCTLTAAGMAAAPAYANDWDYAIDSFNDGYDMGAIGEDSIFEFYGMAVKSTADQVFVALSSNLPWQGDYTEGGGANHVGYGDLFLNFSGKNFADAEADGDLFGVRFTSHNDTNEDLSLGVYRNVTSEDLTGSNFGFKSIWDHASTVYFGEDDKHDPRKDGMPSYGDLNWRGSGGGYTDYFGGVRAEETFATSIASGERIGDVQLLNASQLAGLDFGQHGASGDHTFGFSFDRSLLPEAGGDFIAHLVAECLNDGMALIGKLPKVTTRVEVPDPVQEAPEPALASGLLLLGSLGVLKRRTQQKAETA